MAVDVNEAYGLTLTNSSGGALVLGDVVIQDTAAASSFTTSTTLADRKVLGILGINTANAATGVVQTRGPMGGVKVTGVVAIGDYLTTHTTATLAVSAGTAWKSGVFAIALTAAAGPGAGTVTALLLGRCADGLAITAAKTLTVTDSATLANAAITLANTKVLTLTDTLTNEGGNAGVLHWDAAATLTIPASGTPALLATANVFTVGQEISLSSGDPVVILDIGGVDKFAVGVDDSDSDVFKVCAGSALVTTGGLFFDGSSLTAKSVGNANLVADAAVGSTSAIRWDEAGTFRYQLGYDATNNLLYLYTTDSDGAGTDAYVWKVPDGQLSIDANTTWDANVFDWVCGKCGWHGPDKVTACPDCGGAVAWQDDAALMFAAGRGGRVCDMPEKTLEELVRVGVLSRDGDQIFLRLQKAQWFTMSAIAQLWQRLNKLEAIRA